jgi:formate-dependent nitrite reductase cytochrome c552 subunit
MRINLSVVTIAVLVGIGCASVQEKIPFVGDRLRTRNEGFSLLYELTTKQRDVDKILILKHIDAKAAREIKEIAQTFRQAQEQFDAFAHQDSSLNYKAKHLPVVEDKTRDSIQSTTTKDLLFSSGKDFELRLLLTQVQALDYASHLASVLENQDDNKERKSFLSEFSKQCDQHYKNVMQLLFSL